MRNAWLTTIAAACAALGITGSSALAGPASMALTKERMTKSTAPAAEFSTTTTANEDALRPSAQISPTRNPLKYFRAAISELPIGTKMFRGGASTNPVMQPAPQHHEPVAQNQPVGPPTPQLLISMAQTSERQGNIQQARQYYSQALSMWPGHVEVLRAAARMEDRLGELPLAESLYQQAVAANPQHAGARNDLGLCLARQGKLEASVEAIEQAVNLQPDKPLYRNNAATVLVELRQDQRALGHLAAVHGPAEANYNLGQLLVQRGRADEATPFFQAAVEQNPEMQSAHVALAKLQGEEAPEQTEQATATPPAAPNAAPQQAQPAGPQFYYYPATARSPQYGASSYVPPTYYAPPAGGVPRVNAGPAARYLPPVARQPGPVQR
jgi:tetratricopeptide (TPR) repeat protein